MTIRTPEQIIASHLENDDIYVGPGETMEQITLAWAKEVIGDLDKEGYAVVRKDRE